MARNRKKFNLPKSLRIRNLLIAAIVIAFFLGIFNWGRSFTERSPYFRIEKVEIVLIGGVPLTKETVESLLSIHKGRGIFDVDLKATRAYILANYPEVRRLVINRVFPNKLVLIIRPRKPVAQVQLPSGYCLVDAEAVVLPGIRGLPLQGLPLIGGIDSRPILSSTGRHFNHSGLKRALRLIEIIRQTKFSRDHDIHMIDVSDDKNLSLYIEGGIEIKLGAEDFKNRFLMLEKTFETGRLNKEQIKYIDLRFDNVIIGPR
ncbi:MAG: cell division protein FtsQ/DivIB [Candidatus Omnitrophica bacterium]|nr:cell division protein FtsQ/DivIB [Candidatus Omnitrophota bacterium]